MKTHTPQAITATGKVLRRVAMPAALAAALLAQVITPGTAAADSRAVPKDRPELQQAIQAFVDAGFLGMQARVTEQRGEWVGIAGVSKLGQSAKPPTNGRFWTGSVMKTFVATQVLQLVDEGKIRLDDSVAGYLPQFELDPAITVRMLLQHTSGLFSYTGEYYADGTFKPGIPAIGDEWLPNRFKTYQPEELVRLALSKEPRFTPPGSDQNYSNTNYTVAMLLIEKVTGRSYAKEMERRILRPLGLSNTRQAGTRTQLPGPHAHGYYSYKDGGQEKVVDISRQNLSLLPGAGDLISTTQDLATFFSALNSGKLVPAPLLAEMRKPREGELRYGLGVRVEDLGPECGTVYEHNGSPPHGYGTLMYSSPDGKKTLTASITWVDSATRGPAVKFEALRIALVKEVFCGEKA